jgi:ATP-dependent helicase HrpA
VFTTQGMLFRESLINGETFAVPLSRAQALDAVDSLARQLYGRQFDWLVPGMIRDKVAACLKALPKAIRKRLIPVPEHVTRFLEWVDRGGESVGARGAGGRPPFEQALVAFVKRETGEAFTVEAWRAIQQSATSSGDLPAHLRMNYRVVDDAGRELALGRDLPALRAQLGEAAQLAVSEAGSEFERSGITAWDFGELPASIAVTQGGRRLTAHPGIEDEGKGVALRLFDTEPSATASTRRGVVRLMRLEMKEPMRMLEKRVRDQKEALLALRLVAPPDALVEDVVAAVADRAFIGDDPLPRSKAQYEQQRTRARARVPAVADGALRLLGQVGQAYAKVAPLVSAPPPALARIAADMRVQLARLVHPGFMQGTPWEQLPHLPRYLKAMELRLAKYPGNPDRDRKHAEAIAGLARRIDRRLEERQAAGEPDPGAEALRWQVEELRVSLFAQELRTPAPVSIKRLQKAWEDLQ